MGVAIFASLAYGSADEDGIKSKSRRNTCVGGINIFGFGIKNKTVKELRKNQGLTVKELAQHLKIDTIEIMKVDDKKVKDLSETLKTKIIPILRGDYIDKVPWL